MNRIPVISREPSTHHAIKTEYVYIKKMDKSIIKILPEEILEIIISFLKKAGNFRLMCKELNEMTESIYHRRAEILLDNNISKYQYFSDKLLFKGKLKTDNFHDKRVYSKIIILHKKSYNLYNLVLRKNQVAILYKYDPNVNYLDKISRFDKTYNHISQGTIFNAREVDGEIIQDELLNLMSNKVKQLNFYVEQNSENIYTYFKFIPKLEKLEFYKQTTTPERICIDVRENLFANIKSITSDSEYVIFKNMGNIFTGKHLKKITLCFKKLTSFHYDLSHLNGILEELNLSFNSISTINEEIFQMRGLNLQLVENKLKKIPRLSLGTLLIDIDTRIPEFTTDNYEISYLLGCILHLEKRRYVC